MITIIPDHITKLIAYESEIHYCEPPQQDGNGRPYIVIESDSQVLLSAPHGARTFRNNGVQIWHEEDEYTAGMAILLGHLCGVSVIATNSQNNVYDPNYTVDLQVPYKRDLLRLIQEHHIHYVIDLHGAALNSTFLDPKQTIDLGLRQRSRTQEPSMDIAHVEVLESLLLDTRNQCDSDSFVVGRNRLAGASEGTVITFASNQMIEGTNSRVQAIQIEMKPQVRIAYRFPTATLFSSCGSYQARPENVIHMLQSLVDFIDYLKITDK